ncbi:hypothetical protein NLU13_0722 [Sarocladium strictum]|uniref:Mannan endo-1,6-alpha-mannosidase n=1 Tax=Sarocladium strictum TaxID=5046 RepID=A0AA39GPV5_SARSR|nr:hypothetical protein NLU13_0722 [Sarocladium strictum]
MIFPRSVVALTVLPSQLNISSPYSIRNVAATLAYDTMKYYDGNVSTNPLQVGDLHMPYYWWVAGLLWGTMLDYYHLTKDPTYNDVVIQALLAAPNLGENQDYVPQDRSLVEGNDDLFFWGTAVMAAAERNFPQPNANLPSWLQLAENVFNSLLSRWNISNKCGGGLLWQIYANNPNGLTYKNSVSNGGFFHLAARLHRATGNATYLEWAEKVWDWSVDIGLVDNQTYHIFDGVNINDNCQTVNRQSFTYTSGIYLYGAAVLANQTESQTWSDRAQGLLKGGDWYFSPYPNATDIMYEAGCEPYERCTVDSSTHKSVLARYMWQTIQMMPSLREDIETKLNASAKAAAKSCTGGQDQRTCGLKWYTGGYDGNPGLGPQVNALGTIQGLLIDESAPPLKGDQIQTIRDTNWTALDTYKPDSPPPPPPEEPKNNTDTNKDGKDEEDAAPCRRSDGVLMLGAMTLAVAVGILLAV